MAEFGSLDEVLRLPDDVLARVLTELLETTDARTLAIALSGSSRVLIRRLLKNVPVTVRNWLEEKIEAEARGVPREKVKETEWRVLEDIGRLVDGMEAAPSEGEQAEPDPSERARSEEALLALIKRPLAELRLEDIDEMLFLLTLVERRDGKAGLQAIIDLIESDYLREGIQMAMDATNPGWTRKVLDARTESLLDEWRKKYLKLREGILAIQVGSNPGFVLGKVRAIF